MVMDVCCAKSWADCRASKAQLDPFLSVPQNSIVIIGTRACVSEHLLFSWALSQNGYACSLPVQPTDLVAATTSYIQT